MVRQIGKLPRSTVRAVDRVCRFKLGIGHACTHQQHSRVGTGGKTSDAGMSADHSAQLPSPAAIVEHCTYVACPFPEAEEAFRSMGFGTGVAVMIDRKGDEAPLRQAMGQPFETGGNSPGAMREQHEGMGPRCRFKSRVTRNRLQPKPRCVRYGRLDCAVIRRIPGRPGKRPGAATLPVRPLRIKAEALCKAHRHRIAPIRQLSRRVLLSQEDGPKSIRRGEAVLSFVSKTAMRDLDVERAGFSGAARPRGV